MHPCCWGPFFQSLLQALPFLALVLLGGKKLFSFFKPLLPFASKKSAPSPDVLETQPISVEVEKPGCCGGQKISFDPKN